jgi:hypothetical protein
LGYFKLKKKEKSVRRIMPMEGIYRVDRDDPAYRQHHPLDEKLPDIVEDETSLKKGEASKNQAVSKSSKEGRVRESADDNLPTAASPPASKKPQPQESNEEKESSKKVSKKPNGSSSSNKKKSKKEQNSDLDCSALDNSSSEITPSEHDSSSPAKKRKKKKEEYLKTVNPAKLKKKQSSIFDIFSSNRHLNYDKLDENEEDAVVYNGTEEEIREVLSKKLKQSEKEKTKVKLRGRRSLIKKNLLRKF